MSEFESVVKMWIRKPTHLREMLLILVLTFSVLASWSATLLFSPRAALVLSQVPGVVEIKVLLEEILTRPTIYEERSKVDSK